MRELDFVGRRVKALVLTEVARAHGVVAVVTPESCEECGGDGCERCAFTGVSGLRDRRTAT